MLEGLLGGGVGDRSTIVPGFSDQLWPEQPEQARYADEQVVFPHSPVGRSDKPKQSLHVPPPASPMLRV